MMVALLGERRRWRIAGWLSVAALALGSAYPAVSQAQRRDSAGERAEEARDVVADGFAARLSLGMGATERIVEFDSIEGRRLLDTALVPAADLLLRVGVTRQTYLLDLQLRYQTSLWSEGLQAAPNSTGRSTPIRVHRFEGGLLPGLRLGKTRDAVALSAFAGYGLRSVDSVGELLVPPYTLHGPLLRVELAVPFAGVVQLRLAPELHVITSISQELRERASLEGSGLSLGGEVALRAAVVDWLAVELSYREAHSTVGSLWDTSFSDVERYLFVDALLRHY